MEFQVAFQSEGEDIFGVLHLPEEAGAGERWPGVIMCHGFTGTKVEPHRLFVDAARRFARHGLAALRFDFRGSGDSAGEFREMTVAREIADAKRALDFVSARAEIDASRLGVVGLSLGGCVAACLAGADERVKALALWSATAHPDRIAERTVPAAEDGEVIDYNGLELGREFIEELPRVQPLVRVAKYAGPGLVIHGGCDEIVPPADAREYAAALGERGHLYVIDGADHVFASLPWKREVIALTRDFLVRELRL